ncbi:hypothetical protein ES703_96580 [subsurface metagenome]
MVIGDYNDITPVKERIKTAEFCFITAHRHEHDYTVLKQVLALIHHSPANHLRR